jgi:hypothetical protein
MRMTAQEALKAVREKLEAKRDMYKKDAGLVGPGVHRDLLYDRASMLSEALVMVGDVEKIVESRKR